MRKENELPALVRRYITQAGAGKKQTLEAILAFDGAERSVYDGVFAQDQRACLRVLADACKKKKSREIIAPLVIRDIDRLLAIADDKARKTAYALIGLCAPDECAAKLAGALKNEQIRFVRPSLILALGNTADPRRYLAGYVVEPGEEKHVCAEQQALKKALGRAAQPKKALALSLPEECALTSIKQSALVAELKEKGCRFREQPGLAGALVVQTKDIAGLRCYVDALYALGGAGEYGTAAQWLDAFGCRGLSYRIEAGGVGQRLAAIREVSAGLAEYGYVDNPSAYSFEIRLAQDGGMYAVFPGDDRFSYRKQSVAAGIHPVTAASIMRLCKPFMKEDASVLDPFCGSATMLIERAYIKKTAALVGVDISPVAIKAACANRQASGLKIGLIRGDILGYGAARYDEIISNMPFGIRVSGHESNIRLYTAFVDKLPSLLKSDGAAFLFTQEKKLFREVFRDRTAFSIVREEHFESGGLCPTLFILTGRKP